MRTMLVLLALTAGCSGGGHPSGQVDAADAPPDAPPGPFDGPWWVEWSCTAGCGPTPGRPILTRARMLDVEGAALGYSDTTCLECAAQHAGTVDGGCIEIAGAEEAELARDTYRLCRTDAEHLGATVTWHSRFGPPASTTWAALIYSRSGER